MRGDEENRGVTVEDVLRAVAVVHVKVEDENPLQPVDPLRMPRCDGDAAEDAEAHGAGGYGVVARGAANREGCGRLLLRGAGALLGRGAQTQAR